jgi:glycosyltransferase domain-containing protein
MSQRLTVVLPLKGRYPWTFRFLAHADRMRLPYRFLIADGEVDEAVAGRLSAHRDLFPHLDIEYIRYPDDRSLQHFFRKMADVCGRVRTPYAMLADNDDFLGFAGIERALDFLDDHPDYVCARGQILAFSLIPSDARGSHLEGRPSELTFQYNTPGTLADLPGERLRAGLNLGNYYAVCRAESLATICKECVEIDFSDYMLHESFHSLRLSTCGKSHVDGSTISYFRQMRTSSTYRSDRDWVRHLLDSRFTIELQAMTDKISAAAVTTEDVSRDVTDEIVRATIESYLREFLYVEFGLSTQVRRRLSRGAPAFVRRARDRWSRLRSGWERRSAALKSARGDRGRAGALLAQLDELECALFSVSSGPAMAFARQLVEVRA